MRKKPENRLNRENPKKNNWKNRTEKKNRLNRLNFWKNWPVRFSFGFINNKPKNQTEPNRNDKKPEKNRAKPKKTEPNRFEPVFTLKNRTEPKPVGLTWFRFFFSKKINFGLVTFFDKNRTEPKMITPIFNVKLPCAI